MWNKESGSIWESRKNDMDVLIGSDKDLSLGKSSSGGSGGSDSSSSGGGSGGYTNGYAATAAGMAEYAYSRIGDNYKDFWDDPIFKAVCQVSSGMPLWCAAFIEYCGRKVGYKTSNIKYLTDETRGLKPYNTSTINKGFTFFMSPNGNGHHGIIWSKSSTTIVTIEGNSNYRGNQSEVQKIWYYWDPNRQVYYRDDDKVGYYMLKYMPNY